MIEFLQDYTTEALPPETFQKGQRVERSDDSEQYFVRRGLAGFVHRGELVDAEFRPIADAGTVVEIVQPGNRRLDATVRAGEVMTGQPPRASSGPGTPFVEARTGTVGAPPVVLEAEIERLKAEVERLSGEVLTGADQFRDMNNSHVADKDALRAELAQTSTDLSGRLAASDQRIADLTAELAQTSTDLSGRLAASDQRIADLTAELDTARHQVSELEQLLEAASRRPEAEVAASKTKRG